jgi:Protein of unknown function (DUF3105)
MMLRLLPLLLVALTACSSEDDACAGFDFPLDPVPESTAHVACTATCGNGLNPPTAGAHCAQTLACRTYAEPQSTCHWVHNLEHGHLVLLYDCPGGCPEVVDTLQQIAAEAKQGSNGVRRAIVAPASGLPTRTAALLWRRSLQAETPDAEALRCFAALQDEAGVVPEPGLNCAP